jgi:hypothetical protein
MPCQIDRREFIKRAMADASFSISPLPTSSANPPGLERKDVEHASVCLGRRQDALEAGNRLARANNDTP